MHGPQPGTSTSLGTFSPRSMDPSLTGSILSWHQAYLNKAAFFQLVQTPSGLAVEAFRLPVVASLTQKRRLPHLITTEGCLHSALGYLCTLFLCFPSSWLLGLNQKSPTRRNQQKSAFFQSPFCLVLPDGFPTFEASFL